MAQFRKLGCFSTIVALAAIAAPLAANADPAIRMSWQTFAQDPGRVASFRHAVAAMKGFSSADHTGANYRKSWEYWANIHGYFGPQSPFGTLAENLVRVRPSDRHFFNGVSDVTPPDQIAQDVWAQCEHGTPWFFAWHRLYLLLFEKQLQAAATDPDLRLPYWDYTDTGHLAMPAEFTQPTYKDGAGVDQPNPLYEDRRAPEWRAGGVTLDSNSTNVDDLLNNEKAFASYQSGVEQGVHGNVHCSVATGCPVADMGSVPYSANDPIFWIHHANIDRLWSCWSVLPGRTTPSDPAFVNQSYTFIDDAGAEITKKVGDLFTGTLVDYKYEQETNCARVNAPVAIIAAATPAASTFEMLASKPMLNMPTPPTRLTGAVTKVKVELRKDEASAPLHEMALGARVAEAARTQLILSGISFANPPGAQIYVYLEDAANPERREYAGTINFFGASPAGSHAHHNRAAATDAGAGLTRKFDVTAALRKLGAARPNLDSLTVSFEAANGRAGSTEAAEVETESELTVKSIDFRVVPGG